VLDLFSGIGGFSLGLEKTGGFKTVGFSEINPACVRLLNHHWPGAPVVGDVWNGQFSRFGPVDVVTAGFPCQDISLAGKGAGLAGDRSSAFWAIFRAVRMVGRPIIVLENVAALLNRGMGTVLGALAAFGYDTEWHRIPASAVGAPHGRPRTWIVAYPQRDEQPRAEPCVRAFGRMGRIEQSVAWDGHWEATLSALRGMDDGISRSVDRTDGLRNAIVPQIATEIGHAILAAEKGR